MTDLDGLDLWLDLNITEGERRILSALTDLIRSGEQGSLSAAAKAVGVNDATARSWRARHSAFDQAVDAVLARTPRPEPEPVIEPPVIDRRPMYTRAELEAEIADAKMSLRHENARARLRMFADPSQARRRLALAEGRLKGLTTPSWETPKPTAQEEAS